MSHILIVGQKFSTLTEYLLAHGHEYTLLQDVAKTKFPDKKFKNRIVTDFSNEQTIYTALTQLKKPADGVIATYENYVLPAAYIARHLELPGMPIPAAEACTDKSVMRSLFAKAPEKISPAYAVVNSEPELRAFAYAHSFPLILKPANLAKSLLVTKSSSIEELVNNYRHSISLLSTTYKKYAPNRAPKLLVEEFLEGTIHSVDAFVDASGEPHILNHIVDYETGYDIGYDDNFHYSRVLPSRLAQDAQKALIRCAEIGIHALGMKNSPAHVEIIMTKAGPRIVEIGARNGGYRERMHSLANGIDITRNALALALHEPLAVSATRDEACAVLELFPKQLGVFVGLENLKALQELPSFHYLSIKAKTGQTVGKSGDGYKMCAVVILHASTYDALKNDLVYVRNHVTVNVR